MDVRSVFDSDATRAMALAFDRTCEALGVMDLRDSTMTKAIANTIVEFAREGERDPDQLCALTVHALVGEPD